MIRRRAWQLKVYKKYAGREPEWYTVFTGPVFLVRALDYVMRERFRRGHYEPLMLVYLPTGEHTRIVRDWPHVG